jgi:SAM-dependent methyltransferase
MSVVTGERVVTAEGGFGPTWQRHVAAYRLSAPFLPAGKVLDLGCGVGHSFGELAPRESVGVDIDPDALAGQDRPTVVADMRKLPFDAAHFASLLSVHSLEHVPDPERVLAEAVRVVAPGGVAVFVTPNRLTFGRPDEIIDPYHYVEWDAEQLRALCAPFFSAVEVHGIFGSERYQVLVDGQHARLDRLLALDPLRVRRWVPMRARQRLYDRLLTRARRDDDPSAAAIVAEDFTLGSTGLERCLDVVAVCHVSG